MGPGQLIWIVLACVAGTLIGGIRVLIAQRILAKSRLDQAIKSAQQLVEEAERTANEIELAAQKEALRRLNETEQENQRKAQELRREDERLQGRREALDTGAAAFVCREDPVEDLLLTILQVGGLSVVFD